MNAGGRLKTVSAHQERGGRELAPRGRCGYVGFLAAARSTVIAPAPLREQQSGPSVLPIGLVTPAGHEEPDPIAEGVDRG